METFNQYVLDNWMLFLLLFVMICGSIEGLKYIMRWNRESSQIQAENDLKREMVLRGMSADEIVRVLNKTASPQTDVLGNSRNPLAELGQALAIQEVSAPIMEAILTHFATIPEPYQPGILTALKAMIDHSVEESALLAATSSFAKAYASQAKNHSTV